MSRKEILQKLAAGEISSDEADQMLADLDDKKKTGLYCKVSPKGGISVYGLQRFPITLYGEQWERLLDFADEIRAFAKDHASQLKRKE